MAKKKGKGKGKDKGKGKKGGKKSKASKESLAVLYNGTGEFTLPNGDSYSGEYCAHRSGLLWREGHGIYKTQDGQTYEGDWRDDKLIENKEIIITYPSGVKYYGCIAKNKYNGPGTYSMPGNMDISCNFLGNKPTGIVTLIDCQGKLWLGTAEENSVVMIPENIFYLNTTECKGKGVSKDPVVYPSESKTSNASVQNELTDREWEIIIFAKSLVTDVDIDFTDCAWWKDYATFRERFDEIKDKIANNEVLTNEDYIWIEHFNRYKRKRQKEKEEKLEQRKRDEEHAFALNEIFRSEDFVNSCPGAKVFYPSSPASSIDLQGICEKPSDQIGFPQSGVLIRASTVIPSVTLKVFDVLDGCKAKSSDGYVQFNANVKSYDAIKKTGSKYESENFDKLIRSKEREISSLHFTTFREQMLSETAKKVKQENKMFELRRSKMTDTDDFGMNHIEEKPHLAETHEVHKESTAAPAPPLDKKGKLERRMKECIEGYLHERKKRLEAKPMVVQTEHISPHTHNTAAYTESITGLPRDLLLDK